MSFIRRMLVTFRRAKARYGEEVLFAGWVQLPALFRRRRDRRP